MSLSLIEERKLYGYARGDGSLKAPMKKNREKRPRDLDVRRMRRATDFEVAE